ncbi:MAG: VC0807 family protein [Rubrobacteraceae bacterium]
MNRSLKLGLDFLFGLIIPVIILSRFSGVLGNIPAYVVSALVPVAWVAVDLFFITKRFNFITSFLGLSAVVRGALAFWFVDGVAYAFKDSAPSLLWVVVFGGSLVFGRPLISAFLEQTFDPRTPEQERSIRNLFDERSVRRTLWLGTFAMVVLSIITGIANFFLNLWIVTAQFGTEAFNVQVAEANAIARFAIAIPEALALMVVVGLALKAIYARLPGDPNDKDFWELLEARQTHKKEEAIRET